LVAFACLWCAIGWMVAQFGWSTLAAKYRTDRQPPAEIYSFCSGTINWFANYRGVLKLGFMPEGLYLSVIALFRIGHPPLLIPWSDIKVLPNSGVFFWKIPIGNPIVATLWLTPRMARKMKERMP